MSEAANALPLPGPLRLTPALPFVGRGAELTLLAKLWNDARAEGRRVALVGGEPGCGKTRLAWELAGRASADGAAVLYGACDANLTSPYQPVVEALTHLIDHLDRDALRAAAGPRAGELARLLPDLPRHLPEHLARAAGDAPLLVIATYRPDELEPGAGLAATMAELHRQAGIERIALA